MNPGLVVLTQSSYAPGTPFYAYDPSQLRRWGIYPPVSGGADAEGGEDEDDDLDPVTKLPKAGVETVIDPAAKARADSEAAARVKHKLLATELASKDAKIQELATKVQEFELVGKTEIEKRDVQIKAFEAKISEQEKAIDDLNKAKTSMGIDYAIVTSPTASRLHNPGDAKQFIDASKLEFGDSGLPTNVDELLKGLESTRQYLFKEMSEGDRSKNEVRGPSGTPFNGQKGKNDGLDMAALAQKFPSLRSRIHS